MGLTQHKHAVATIEEVVNLLLLRGNIGRQGAGLCPVRGHSNVQGDRTMGIYHLPRPQFLDALGAEFGFKAPTLPGQDVIEACEAMEHGKVGVFFGMGGNFLQATPDTPRTAAGLERTELTIGVTTKLNRTHLYPGKRALLLPCLGRSEIDPAGFVTVEDSMSIIHRSEGVLQPASPELRGEPQICAMLGKAMFGSATIAWDALGANYDLIRDHISRVVPGFTDFNERVRTPNGFQLPNVGRDRPRQRMARWRARRRGIHRGAVRHSARQLLHVLSRDQRARPHGQPRRTLAHADLEVGDHSDPHALDLASLWTPPVTRRPPSSSRGP